MPSKELIAASTRPLLLALLADSDNYGYALIMKVRELSGGTLQWREGMLYPVLHRLEDEGLVVSDWRASGTGRKRKYYRLTKHGGQAALKERAEWLSIHSLLHQLWPGEPADA